MSTFHKIGFAMFLLLALIGAAGGMRYLLATQIMPYHLEAIGSNWQDLAPGYQFMFLGLMRGVGLGMLTFAVAAGFLLFFAYRQGLAWSRWALAGISLLYSGVMLGLVFIIKLNTPASPPVLLNSAMLAMAVLGSIFSLTPCRSSRCAA